METRSKSRRGSIDRFSSLPDDVAVKVVSFLEMQDISRLSVVSKRYAHKRARLTDYLKRLLILRTGMHTQESRIRWCLESSFNFAEEEHRVLSLLHYAVKFNLKQLVIDVNLKRGLDFVLPSSLFCCKSLESARMRFSNGTGILKVPPSIGDSYGFSSLKCLKMEDNRALGRWEPQDVLFFRNLKFATIELVSQGKNEIELMKFIHETAKDLRKYDRLWQLQGRDEDFDDTR
ncbi:hypothetical protein TIFTF001_041446 [Ficus carica]|uniref:F-box domain-containing protein n=1 Tax=Ficus carica TaxID=3494 RepID=A0AA87Z9A9_FICCA|nr:hypothetical protein TIFTF001_041444 [Ficus carica]GMN30351.1 hypothetical protein TIFTF001_041446 [Ficus carica]